MKVILNEDVINLGEEGDVVVVKPGYARNFLLPRGKAVRFNKANEAIFASRAAAIEKRKEEKRKQSSSLKEQLEKVEITLVLSAGESGKLFGSVTNATRSVSASMRARQPKSPSTLRASRSSRHARPRRRKPQQQRPPRPKPRQRPPQQPPRQPPP